MDIESVIFTKIKFMTRVFDNYFPYRRKHCIQEHVWSRMKLRTLFEKELTKTC
ncbi:hypothetical protein HRbin02_00976 [Candidatus Calditenuaceae archaeon HR02]|nr:hypothetical protein HRbin02_00976 [Candidatus Calditenuaceae archaeon HR02]